MKTYLLAGYIKNKKFVIIKALACEVVFDKEISVLDRKQSCG